MCGAEFDDGGEFGGMQCGAKIDGGFPQRCSLDLSQRRSDSLCNWLNQEYDCRTTPINKHELRKQLKTMANNKSADGRGIVAEILKDSSDKTLDLIAMLFNDVLEPEAEPPAT